MYGKTYKLHIPDTVFKLKKSVLFNSLAKVVPSLNTIAVCIAANEALETTDTSDYKVAYEAHICAVYSNKDWKMRLQNMV